MLTLDQISQRFRELAAKEALGEASPSEMAKLERYEVLMRARFPIPKMPARVKRMYYEIDQVMKLWRGLTCGRKQKQNV